MSDRRFGTLLLGVGLLASTTLYLTLHEQWQEALVSIFCCGVLTGVGIGIRTGGRDE